MNPTTESKSASPGFTSSPTFPSALTQGLQGSYMPSLDGLRAIAAFLVVFYHAGVTWAPGGLGVLAFFVLSGFLITWLLLKEEEHSGRVSLKLFYIRRSLRIFPAFYVYWFLVVGLLVILHKQVFWGQAIASFFYVNDYYQGIFGDPNSSLSHTWSLGVEEQFYLLWPMAFLLVRNRRAEFLACAILAVWIYRLVLVLGFHVFQGYVYEAFDTRADHLLVGCLLAVLLRSGRLSGQWKALCASPSLVWLTLALLATSTALAMRLEWYRDTIGFIVDPVMVVVLIVQCIASSTAGFASILNWGWFSYLGRISYSVYLYQQIVMGPIEKLTTRWPMLTMPAQIATVILLASASYKFVETPFLKLKKRFAP